MKIFVWTVIVIVAASVIAGFFIVGSPQEERVRRFDERRVQDLQFLQSEIVNYWQNKEHLPQALSALKDDIRGIVIPKDPESGADYGYEVKGSETFALCAVFARPSASWSSEKTVPRAAPDFYYGGVGQNWEHDAGAVCFERTIDKEFYKLRKAP